MEQPAAGGVFGGQGLKHLMHNRFKSQFVTSGTTGAQLPPGTREVPCLTATMIVWNEMRSTLDHHASELNCSLMAVRPLMWKTRVQGT